MNLGPLTEVPETETERVLRDRLTTSENPSAALWDLARFYNHSGRSERAIECLRDILARTADPEARAECLLALGQATERLQDPAGALELYKQALVLEPSSQRVWYLLHNNLGSCLNALGRFADGERYGRRAVQIEPGRPHGHLNLGISLHGQGRCREAVRAWIRAVQADAGDGRALKLMERVIAEHEDLAEEFANDLHCCRLAVDYAEREVNRSAPRVRGGLRARWFLFRLRWGRRMTRLRRWLRTGQ
ncbi:MAG TPA: tetratricopeptide repeat protein [Verrucomicrobiota bacterium]|nr:tetratricopeptide repeat protein [Verrucomicrobiota bacterium]HNU51456.1 tetratricopeptide repeat protein [Verrucomicrobiota bacterium]